MLMGDVLGELWDSLRDAVESSNVSRIGLLLFKLISRPMEDVYRYASPHNNILVNVGRDNVIAISIDNVENGVVYATVYLKNRAKFHMRVDTINRELHILALSTC